MRRRARDSTVSTCHSSVWHHLFCETTFRWRTKGEKGIADPWLRTRKARRTKGEQETSAQEGVLKKHIGKTRKFRGQTNQERETGGKERVGLASESIGMDFRGKSRLDPQTAQLEPAQAG